MLALALGRVAPVVKAVATVPLLRRVLMHLLRAGPKVLRSGAVVTSHVGHYKG